MQNRFLRFRRVLKLALPALAGVAAATPAAAADGWDCYDAEVSATIVRQVPSVIPECRGCIIMRWPWFIDLYVRRVHDGAAPRGPLTVLTVQHTDFRTDRGPFRWRLRRNSLGGFNADLADNRSELRRCPRDAGPAMPFIGPGPGQTLDDLRRAGEEQYGRDDDY